MKRIPFVIYLCVLSCDAPEPTITADLNPKTPYCVGCDDPGCTTMEAWCRTAQCPDKLVPVICSGLMADDYEQCVFVGVTICEDTYDTTWCCSSDGSDLGTEWWCSQASDCPAAPPCMQAECWPFAGYGPGKCHYAVAATGTACSGGVCSGLGTCL